MALLYLNFEPLTSHADKLRFLFRNCKLVKAILAFGVFQCSLHDDYDIKLYLVTNTFFLHELCSIVGLVSLP